LAGTPGGLFRSTNNGDSWSLSGTGLPGDEIKALSVGDDGKLYAGTGSHGIYRSTDNGATWIEANSGLPSSAEVTALLAVKNFETVYAGLFPNGAFMSVDNGITWLPYNQGLPFSKEGGDPRNYSITDIVCIILIVLLVIYDYGVFANNLDISRGPNTWVEVNAGLPPDPHVSCLIRGPDAQVYLGARDQGLFTNAYPVNIPVPGEGPANASVSCTPNPFTESATFIITLPGTEDVSLRIFDMAGTEVYVTENRFSPGKHLLAWTPSGVSPGIYLYLVKAGETVIRGKTVFLSE
jgi:hypothetical protein